MTGNGRPIHPRELPPNFSPKDVRRMLASWRGQSNWPKEVIAMQRMYKALVEQTRRFNAALDEVHALEAIIDRTRKRLTVDTDTLIQEAKERRATSSFLSGVWREALSDTPKRASVEAEVIDRHKSEYHSQQHMQEWREQAGVGRRTVDGQQRKKMAEQQRQREAG